MRRLRIAAMLVSLGLIVEIISLRWAHPTAFLVFAFGTGASVAIGCFLFLSTLISTGPDRET